MRKVGVILLFLLLLLSCESEEFVINTSRASKSCIDGVDSFSLFFDISTEDEYQIEVTDSFGLVWKDSLILKNGVYTCDDFIIPYNSEDADFNYKIIASSGRFIEGQFSLNECSERVWTVNNNTLIPSKAITSKITLITDTTSTSMITDKEVEIPSDVKRINIEYTYLSILYRYTITI